MSLLFLLWAKPILAEGQNSVALVSLPQSTTGESSLVELTAEQLTLTENERSQESILLRISQRGNVMVAGLPYDFPPYSFLDDNGQLVGFDVDLLQAVAANWGVRVEFVPALAADAMALLAGGAVDIAPVTWPAFDPQKLLRAPAHINFSQPYLSDNLCLATIQPDGSADAEVNSIQDASEQEASKQIGFITGLGGEKHLIHWLAEWETDIDIANVKILSYRENGPILAAIQERALRSYLTFEDHCRFLADDFATSQEGSSTQDVNEWINEFDRLSDAKQESIKVRFLWGIADGTPQSRNLLNYTLQEIVRTGDYETIHDRWFPHQPIPRIDLYPGEWTETFALLIRSDLGSSNSDGDRTGETLEVETPGLKDGNETNVTAANTAASAESETLSSSAAWQADLVAAGHPLRVGVPYDLPLFGEQVALGAVSAEQASTTPDSDLAGFDVDLALAIYQHLFPQSASVNLNLDESNIELIPIARGAGSRLVAQGELDLLISAYAPHWPESTQVGIGEPYMQDRAGLLISEPPQAFDDDSDSTATQGLGNADSSVASSELSAPELYGTIAYVVDDLAAELWLNEHAAIVANRLPFQEFSAALRALDAGQVDGLAGGVALLQYVASQQNRLRLVHQMDDPITYNIVTGAHQTLLRRAVDSALVEMTIDGTLAALHEKWIGHHEAMMDGAIGSQEGSATSAEGILSESFPLFSATPVATSDSEEDVAEIKKLLVRDLVQSLLSANANSNGSPPVVGASEPSAERTVQPTPTIMPTLEPTPTSQSSAEPTSSIIVDPQEAQAEEQADNQAEINFETHVVGEGDTLITLAVQFYDDQSKWLLIYEANRALIGDNPNYVAPGSTLIIPVEQ